MAAKKISTLLCPNKENMKEHACLDASQCFEPCGRLGHSLENAKSVTHERKITAWKKSDGGSVSEIESS